ncbi:ACT domain-containing protein [Deminuibacter soli]|uniref:DUF2241 domain-containing protein n=1 Tax=Deminuibacter soli TaxID=2291815 RepID=A0A3E1NGR2_9BACT|nr:ACT domain-containing protein [Deminuibacter soli]RFM27146.1 hypothetical protein DXN05_16945 [Deminuibacter soli]
MSGETNLQQLLKTMQPHVNEGTYVLCTVSDLSAVPLNQVVMFFKEQEAYTLILYKHRADALQLSYTFTSYISTVKQAACAFTHPCLPAR